MMLLSIITLILSVIIQSITSNYIGYIYSNLSIFSTIYVLVSLLILKPYFENKKKYILLLIIFGLLTDLLYTNTTIFNTTLFIVCYFISKTFHFIFPYNWLTVSVSNLICISFYHIITFIFLNILEYDVFSLSTLLKILQNSIIMTITFSIIIYLIINFIVKKYELKEVK